VISLCPEARDRHKTAKFKKYKVEIVLPSK
jgi:hypothetical protein